MILRPGKLLIGAFHHCSEKEGKPKKPKSHASYQVPKAGAKVRTDHELSQRTFSSLLHLANVGSCYPTCHSEAEEDLPHKVQHIKELGLEANKIESTAIAATNMRTQPHHWSKHHMVRWSWKQEIDTSDGMAKECNRFLQCWTGARHGYTVWSKVLRQMFKFYTIEIKIPIWAITPSDTHTTYKQWRNMNGHRLRIIRTCSLCRYQKCLYSLPSLRAKICIHLA